VVHQDLLDVLLGDEEGLVLELCERAAIGIIPSRARMATVRMVKATMTSTMDRPRGVPGV
jgi:hypothetical protein